ncbi:permease-like cell division protein FtsX [Metabacillus fastidiosus]|uniref:Cell division protein FtsX n=1 Tax=Metabacillus fastidiosus TaxID=1458 RepID=A0ABU6P2Q3_9BACI|nr:permease-like cell division protein FtsX [Metabacillus fastidiosus]MED4402789.1 permease-like cell division protein FtsX [Metabacillus fastidiosus]MED4454411.1 permease-like cell division protein FtsX [Metabacillus fastidiosus]MED4461218.1 permease-like cell division protein FtsX [Metabacillus fastidiosus]
MNTINSLGRHFKESLKSLARNTWMTFASISAVTVTLILVGTFIVIMMNLNNFADNLENDVEVRVHIDLTADKAAQDTLRQEIEKIPEIESVVFSPKDKELENLIKSLGDEGEPFQLFQQENPLNDVFIVKAKDPHDTKKIAEEIETFKNTAKVKYGQGEVEKLFKVVGVSRNIGLGLIIGLIFTAMFLISNTIKITIFARRREIEIMKLVGATNGFIRWPFFLEGLLLGVFGAVIPILVVIFSYNLVYTWALPYLQDGFFELLPYNPFVFQVSALLLFIGALIGVWGSLMSVRKFLKV